MRHTLKNRPSKLEKRSVPSKVEVLWVDIDRGEHASLSEQAPSRERSTVKPGDRPGVVHCRQRPLFQYQHLYFWKRSPETAEPMTRLVQFGELRL